MKYLTLLVLIGGLMTGCGNEYNGQQLLTFKGAPYVKIVYNSCNKKYAVQVLEHDYFGKCYNLFEGYYARLGEEYQYDDANSAIMAWNIYASKQIADENKPKPPVKVDPDFQCQHSYQ